MQNYLIFVNFIYYIHFLFIVFMSNPKIISAQNGMSQI